MRQNKFLQAAGRQLSALRDIFRGMGRRDRYAALFILALLAAEGLLAAALPLERIFDRPASLVVTDMKGAPLRGRLSSEGEWRLPVPLSEMGRWMPLVAVELEDRRFRLHRGVDIPAALRALWQNARAGRVLSGASTITSQVVRLAVARERTPLNKLIEFSQATALESIADKEKILEIYLNSVPLGGNARGVEAAARMWFGKRAKELSLAEATLLAGILRGPAYYRPDRHPRRARELRDRLIDTLAERGVISRDEAERAKREPLPTYRRGISSALIQAAERAAESGEAAGNLDAYGRFRSTLDTEKQRLLLAELRRPLTRLDDKITAAAVLVENKSGKVRGYIGNAREGTAASSAWVDCAASPRSPGSALKPFLYALAFESGALTPAAMIADLPSSAGGGGARNFDRLFRGPVTARAALRDSLNAPAVRALRMCGTENLLSLLRRLGFSSITKEARWYGESLALGGCEVSPLELARAYSALASGGLLRPLIWNERAEAGEGERVLSEAAAALTLDILKDTRRSLPQFGEPEADGKLFAMKTGTSYGLRDAWAAAVTPRWTLVVWFGEPGGRPHRELTGLRSAAPPAAAIMLSLTASGEQWFRLPDSVIKAEVCPLSGAPRNSFCPQKTTDLRIRGVSKSDPCALHLMKNGLLKTEWPEEIARFFSLRGGTERAKLRIASPAKGAAYYETGGAILLSAQGGEGTLYWFADGELIGAAGERETISRRMSAGKHKIAVADEYGASDEAEISVKKSFSSRRERLPLLEEKR
ncbi:MAG: penicillin-binding protein 1C [Synergistaceae bacterium]|nr:penicillin-binding protein 1C [Synergistaceae bacterium]